MQPYSTSQIKGRSAHCAQVQCPDSSGFSGHLASGHPVLARLGKLGKKDWVVVAVSDCIEVPEKQLVLRGIEKGVKREVVDGGSPVFLVHLQSDVWTVENSLKI